MSWNTDDNFLEWLDSQDLRGKGLPEHLIQAMYDAWGSGFDFGFKEALRFSKSEVHRLAMEFLSVSVRVHEMTKEFNVVLDNLEETK